MSRASLYIHVPFCRSLCEYCDFSRIRWTLDAERRYLSSLIMEMNAALPRQLPVGTLFIGGGTPSSLSLDGWRRLIDALNGHCDLTDVSEWTIEANPESFTDALAALWRESGVTRISFGAQTFQPRLLTALGRIHTADAVDSAVERARAAGIDRVSVDLMYGLPGQTPDDWLADVKRATSLPVEHVSAYALTVEPGSSFGARAAAGQLPLPPDEAVSDMYRTAMQQLSRYGFEQYEISNWRAADDRNPNGRITACLHNMTYWERRPCYALGPSASGFDGQTRWTNIRRFDDWADALNAGRRPIAESETLTGRARAGETIMLALRLNRGIDIDALRRLCDVTDGETESFGPDGGMNQRIELFISRGLMETVGDAIRLTDAGRPVADAILCEFI